jgi:hypothetical protein
VIDRLVNHPRIAVTLCVIGTIAASIIASFSRFQPDMVVFVVSSLIFVSVFFTLNHKDKSRNASYGCKAVTQERERLVITDNGVQNARYQFATHDKNEYGYNESDNPSYPHEASITDAKGVK